MTDEEKKKRHNEICVSTTLTETQKKRRLDHLNYQGDLQKKRAPKPSNLRTQSDVGRHFNNMKASDEVNADRTHERRSEILEVLGSDARKGMTKEAISAKRKELLEKKAEIRQQASLQFQKRNEWNSAYSKSLSKKGQTVVRLQRNLLQEKFPTASGQMTVEETEQYRVYTSTLPKEVRKSLFGTDKMIDQLCAFQYIPRNPRSTLAHPHGTVAYMNAKKLVPNRMSKGSASGKPTETIVKPPISMEWMRYCFKPEYVKLLMKHPKAWHRVEIGSPSTHSGDPPSSMVTTVRVAYQQGEKHKCLFLCLASALHYIGLTEEAENLADASISGEHKSPTDAIAALRTSMELFAPIVGRPTLFNTGRTGRKKKILSLDDVYKYTPFPTVLIPIGSDGSVNHAVCVVDDLIFDSTLPYALKCLPQSMDWICAEKQHGFMAIKQALRFSSSIKCPPLRRIMDDNWEK